MDYGKGLYAKFPELIKKPKLKKLSEDQVKTDLLKTINIVVHSIKVSRFKEKKATINEWMQRDREKQDRFDNAEEAELYCPECNILLEVFMKSLRDFKDEPLRVLYFYKCPRCNFREGQYDTGEKYESKPNLCDKCGSEVGVSLESNKKKHTTTWTHKCTGCDYKKIDIEDDRAWEEKQKKREIYERELLDKYRKEFCFTEKEGNEAVLHSEELSRLVQSWKEKEKKDKDPIYQKARSLKKLKVVELNKLLKETLEAAGYIDLQFEKPEMGKYVVIPFIVQDEKADREEYDSRQSLKKLISKTLEGTNWRLMSEGISYRVGYLSGRLRCYEQEDDLVLVLNESER